MIGPPGFPVRFRLAKGGRTMTIPSIGGRELMDVFADNAWLRIVPHRLEADDSEYLIGRLMDPADRLDGVMLWRAATRVLGGAVGWQWHVGRRLALKAREGWATFDAWSVMKGFDPYTCEEPRLFNAVFAWLSSQCQKDSDSARLEAELFAPPSLPAQVLDEAPLWSAADEGADFMSAYASAKKK